MIDYSHIFYIYSGVHQATQVSDYYSQAHQAAQVSGYPQFVTFRG